MLSGICVTALFFCAVSVCAPPAEAVHVSLTRQQAAEAVAFGRTHAQQIDKALYGEYCVGQCTFFSEYVLVRSKWFKLAHLAALKATSGSTLTDEDKERIMDDERLQIDITVYGNRSDFARDYSVTLVQNNTSIQPAQIHADHTAQQSHISPGSAFPSYRATIRCYFPYGKISPDKTAQLLLRKDGARKPFTINLGDYK